MDLRMKITIPFELFKHNIIDWDNGVVHKIQKSDPIKLVACLFGLFKTL